jgi:hypothetical protein
MPILVDGGPSMESSDSDVDAASDDATQEDSGTELHLVCSEPALAVTTAHTQSVHEPALRTDGLTLTSTGGGRFEATRPAVGEPFEKWTASAAVPAATQDPAFFLHGNKELMIAAFRIGENPRRLRLCEGLFCSDMSVSDESLDPILIDVDGPSVADLTTPHLLVFNAKEEEQTPGVAYLAVQVDSALSTWTARRIVELDVANVNVDDPAISPDGTVIVFGNDDDGDLWSARRGSIDRPFSAPQRMTVVNHATAREVEPELAALPSGELELFFRSDRITDAFHRIYRSVCRK